MALFELDGGQLVPAQFGRNVAEGFSPQVLDAVRAQVLEIVARPLFPVTWRDIGRGHDPYPEPRLTALDASGQVVSVEVVESLDADFLIDSLSRLADTAHMSWTDLANEYPSHLEGFKRGWLQFRESMPMSPPNGPRLIVVAARVSDEVRPALDVLSSSGIEVHEMSLRQMSNGRVFLEIGVVGPRLYGHRANFLLSDGTLPTPALSPRSEKTIESAQSPAVISPSVMPEVDVLEHRQVPPEVPAVPTKPSGRTTTPSAPSVSQSVRPSPRATRPAKPFPSRLDRHRADTGRIPRSRAVSRDQEGLAALTAVVGRPIELAFVFPGDRVATARLNMRGEIETVAGSFTDPTQALQALGVAGMNGWEAWRVGDKYGPTLAESLAEIS